MKNKIIPTIITFFLFVFGLCFAMGIIVLLQIVFPGQTELGYYPALMFVVGFVLFLAAVLTYVYKKSL